VPFSALFCLLHSLVNGVHSVLAANLAELQLILTCYCIHHQCPVICKREH